MEVKNINSVNTFSGIKFNNFLKKGEKNWAYKNVVRKLDSLVIDELDSLGYDVVVFPGFYRHADNIKPASVNVNVIDKLCTGKAFRSIDYPKPFKPFTIKGLKISISTWNRNMCKALGIPTK